MLAAGQRAVCWVGGGGHFTHLFVEGSSYLMKTLTKWLFKIRGEKDLRTMKKGVNWIGNQCGNSYEMLQKCQNDRFG